MADDPQPTTVGPGREDDLPAIASILNEAILTSNATLDTQPRAAAERLGWFRRFAATGPLGQLATEPVHVALAGIVRPNEPSVALHRRFGFREVGVFHDYAIKNGQYLSPIWMEYRFPGNQG